jgi:hypothetical protein
MRTTLDLDYDILTAIKERAQFEGASLGKVASRLIKQALQGKSNSKDSSTSLQSAFTPVVRNGFRSLPINPNLRAPVTLAQVQAIADDEGI